MDKATYEGRRARCIRIRNSIRISQLSVAIAAQLDRCRLSRFETGVLRLNEPELAAVESALHHFQQQHLAELREQVGAAGGPAATTDARQPFRLRAPLPLKSLIEEMTE